MLIFISEIPADFLSSQIGIALQVATLIAVLFSGVKYLNKKLDTRIDTRIQEKIRPVIATLCKQIDEVTNAFHQYQSDRDIAQGRFESKTNTAIKYINRAMDDITDREHDDSQENGI